MHLMKGSKCICGACLYTYIQCCHGDGAQITNVAIRFEWQLSLRVSRDPLMQEALRSKCQMKAITDTGVYSMVLFCAHT